MTMTGTIKEEAARLAEKRNTEAPKSSAANRFIYESFSDVGEIRVWWRANFQSGYRVLKKVF